MFNLSNSTVFSQAVQIGNATALPTPQTSTPSCIATASQQCQCRSVFNSAANSSNLVCDCQTVLNQTFPQSACANCTTYTDVMGNQISLCQCGVQVHTQYRADQYCTCTKSGSDSLLCQTGCGLATNTNPIKLPQSSCNCVNMTTGNVT